MTITEFLLAQIAEDEAIGRDWQHHRGKVEIRGGGTGYIRLASPDRVLAECKAKRRIVELHEPGPGAWCSETCDSESPIGCDTLLALASVYADCPDFNPAWRT